ncbi:unnamed protein product [Microthlaspi erraticum]|uniref:Transmembrane protein n=1 Tax=Microthlaspi erraticum TaxID=1685480 RepID=A0A6D2JIU2_9BRAS|nr:unnamed protein product [Microthlaspi erraticum]
MSSLRMIIQLLSLLFLITIFVTSGRFLDEFDPVPSSATTPLETDYGGGMVGVETNTAVMGIQVPLSNCNHANLPLGNDVHLTSYIDNVLVTKFVERSA